MTFSTMHLINQWKINWKSITKVSISEKQQHYLLFNLPKCVCGCQNIRRSAFVIYLTLIELPIFVSFILTVATQSETLKLSQTKLSGWILKQLVIQTGLAMTGNNVFRVPLSKGQGRMPLDCLWQKGYIIWAQEFKTAFNVILGFYFYDLNNHYLKQIENTFLNMKGLLIHYLFLFQCGYGSLNHQKPRMKRRYFSL